MDWFWARVHSEWRLGGVGYEAFAGVEVRIRERLRNIISTVLLYKQPCAMIFRRSAAPEKSRQRHVNQASKPFIISKSTFL